MVDDSQSFTENSQYSVDLVEAQAALLSGLEFGNESTPDTNQKGEV